MAFPPCLRDAADREAGDEAIEKEVVVVDDGQRHAGDESLVPACALRIVRNPAPARQGYHKFM